MENEKIHLRHVMLYEFRKGVSVGTAQKTFKVFIWTVLLLSGQLKSGSADFEMVITTWTINPALDGLPPLMMTL